MKFEFLIRTSWDRSPGFSRMLLSFRTPHQDAVEMRYRPWYWLTMGAIGVHLAPVGAHLAPVGAPSYSVCRVFAAS